MKLTDEQQYQLAALAVDYGRKVGYAKLDDAAEAFTVLREYVEKTATERVDLIAKRMTDWADELEKYPSGKFIAAEVRNRLKGHTSGVTA